MAGEKLPKTGFLLPFTVKKAVFNLKTSESYARARYSGQLPGVIFSIGGLQQKA
jgi:hypothetical protein